uniref:Uncharacterized protein n=1 Tax=Cacopsylla melanoneura TaxID=428564 RepID=A0A8D8TBL0_9HEMI
MVRCLLLHLLPLLGCVFSNPLPGEKISFNTDLLEKVRAQFNETTRDKTARNINFAWRVSYTRTSTLPTHPAEKTTLAIKDIEQNQVEYQKIFTALTVTLKDQRYRIMWTELVKKGYPHFINEVKSGGHKVFMKDNKDGAFEGEDGQKFWTKIVGFLETMGDKGFELLLSSVDQTPLHTVSPGADQQVANFTIAPGMEPQKVSLNEKGGFEMPTFQTEAPK